MFALTFSYGAFTMESGYYKERGDSLVVLGIDPGYALMGWGVVESEGSRMRLVNYGCIETKAGVPDADPAPHPAARRAGSAHHVVRPGKDHVLAGRMGAAARAGLDPLLL